MKMRNEFMMKILLTLGVTALTACGSEGTASLTNTSPAPINLAGKKYCRIVSTVGEPGPTRQGEHCVAFDFNHKVTDDGSTFFGNPPEEGTYAIRGNVI